MNRPTHPHSFSAHLALVVANVLFGMNFSFFVSIIRHYMAFETLFFARVLFSAVCFIPLTFLYKRFRITRRDFIGILIPTVLVIYGHEFMMLWGAKYTNPLDASTLATMAPIVTLVVSSLIFRERLHWAKIVGIGMGIAGSAVLILGNGWPKMQSEELGNLFMLVSVVAAATNTVFIKPELVRLGTMTVTGWYYVIGVLIAGPFSAATFSSSTTARCRRLPLRRSFTCWFSGLRCPITCFITGRKSSRPFIRDCMPTFSR